VTAELQKLDGFSDRLVQNHDTLCHGDVLDAKLATEALDALFGTRFVEIDAVGWDELAHKSDRARLYSLFRVANTHGLHRLLVEAPEFKGLWAGYAMRPVYDGRSLKDIIRSSVGSDKLQAKFDACRFGHDFSGIFVDDIVTVKTLYFASLVDGQFDLCPRLGRVDELLAVTRSIGWSGRKPNRWTFMVK
jgi:hypothetical protein